MEKDPKDPLYLGIPNICFSHVREDFTKKEKVKYQKQRLKNGFDETEIWSLALTMAQFILPRLKVYKKKTHIFFNELGEDGTNNLLDKMIYSLELVIKDETKTITPEENKKMQEGLELLGKHFSRLWD